MTPKKLIVILSLVLIAGGIVLAQGSVTAQEPAPPPGTPQAPQGGPEISIFMSGGTFLGVYAEDVNKENMSRYGQSQVRGVGLTDVVKSSPAERAGLKKGDVILRFDNEAVSSVRKLNRLVGESAPDQTARLSISRGGSEQEVTVTLGKRNENADAWQMITPPGGLFRGVMPKDLPNVEGLRGMTPNGDGGFTFAFGNNRRIGVSTQQLTKQLADFFGVKDGGVLITSVNENSPAEKAGLKAGDVITMVDGEKIEGPGDVSRALNKKEDGEVTLTVVRERNTRTIKVTPQSSPMAPGQPRVMSGRRIVMPRVDLPTIPEMNIQIPRIQLPSIPEINVVLPRRVRVQGPRQFPI